MEPPRTPERMMRAPPHAEETRMRARRARAGAEDEDAGRSTEDDDMGAAVCQS
jgi:hypothetical protein